MVGAEGKKNEHLEPLDCDSAIGNGDFRALTLPFWYARSGVRMNDCYYIRYYIAVERS